MEFAEGGKWRGVCIAVRADPLIPRHGLTVWPRVPRHKRVSPCVMRNFISEQVGACNAGPYRILIELNAVYLRMDIMR